MPLRLTHITIDLAYHEYKSSVLFFVFHFIFYHYQSQFFMYSFNFSYKIIKVYSGEKKIKHQYD